MKLALRMAAFIVALVVLFPTRARAAPTAIVDASTSQLQLAAHLDVLEDTTAKLGIEDVKRADVAARFEPFRGKLAPNFGFTRSAMWVRFAAENASDVPIERWLVVDFPPVENIEVFRDGEPVAIQGSLHPRSLRELPRRSYSFRLVLAPHDRRVVYARASGLSEVALPLELWELGALGASDRVNASIGALLLGVMAALALYNALLFFFVRERAYLYYAAEVAFVGAWITTVDGTMGDLLPARIATVPHSLNVVCAYSGAIFATAFVRRLLRPHDGYPKLDVALVALAALQAALGVLYLLGATDYLVQNELGQASAVTSVVLGITIAALRWRDGFVAARYLVLAWSALLVFMVLTLLSIRGIVPVRANLLLHAAWAAETVLFSMALAADARQRNDTIAAQHRAGTRFVPHELLALLGRRELTEVRQGDQIEKELTIFFLDVRGFTSIVEKMTPEQTIQFVNAIFSKMEAPIAKHRGVIDKFMGDGIMVLFERADDGVAAAVACLGALDAYNDERAKKGEPRLAIGIGLHTGPLMVGTVGGDERLSCTVIGDNVNLASRIEGMTKTFGASILVSDATRDALSQPGEIEMRALGRVAAKGKARAEGLYEVLDGLPPEERTRKLRTREALEAAVAAFVARDLPAARAKLESCVEADAGDRAVAFYVELCAKIGDDAAWDGAVQLEAK